MSLYCLFFLYVNKEHCGVVCSVRSISGEVFRSYHSIFKRDNGEPGEHSYLDYGGEDRITGSDQQGV